MTMPLAPPSMRAPIEIIVTDCGSVAAPACMSSSVCVRDVTDSQVGWVAGLPATQHFYGVAHRPPLLGSRQTGSPTYQLDLQTGQPPLPHAHGGEPPRAWRLALVVNFDHCAARRYS